MKLFPAAAPPNLAPESAASQSVAFGILLMVVSVGFFATMNMLVKVIGPAYHPLEAVFFRNAIAAVFVIPFVLSSGGLRTLRTRNPLGHALRAICGLASHGLCFYAFQRISLANGMTLTMSVPIFATVFAIVFLGEKVGLHRWTAVVIGFAGVLIALNPTGTIQEGSLYALAGTVFWALVTILVKKLSATESPYTIVFYYMVAGTVAAACFLPWIWVTPDLPRADALPGRRRRRRHRPDHHDPGPEDGPGLGHQPLRVHPDRLGRAVRRRPLGRLPFDDDHGRRRRGDRHRPLHLPPRGPPPRLTGSASGTANTPFRLISAGTTVPCQKPVNGARAMRTRRRHAIPSRKPNRTA